MIDIKEREEALRYLKVVEDIVFEMAEQYSHTGMKKQAKELYEAFCFVNEVRSYVQNCNESEEYEEKLKVE